MIVPEVAVDLPPLQALPLGPPSTILLMQLLQRVGSGEAAQVLRLSEQRLRVLTGDLADGPAGLHLVRAVALRALGHDQQVSAAATMTVAAAERDGEAGWRACALSLRASQGIILGEHDTSVYDADAVIRDLIQAEVVLGDSAGTALEPLVECTAHTSIAAGFELLRLYELAATHQEMALALSAQVPGRWGRTPLWSGNLAALHLTWALELYRLGQQQEALMHADTAGRHAAEAADAARSVEDARWLDVAELFGACAQAAGSDPGAAATRIAAGVDRLRTHELPQAVELASPFLAVALHLSGQAPEALAVIERAERALRPESDWRAMVGVVYTHARLLAVGGSTDAADALVYGERLAQALWRERLRTLHATRTLHEFERLRAENLTVSRSASTDALTGVLNRRGFDERLTELATAASEQTVAVLAIDMDKFKQINDTLGHPAGDLALQHVAAALVSAVRSHDTVARLGGDEFGVLLPGSPILAATRVAQRIVAAVDAVPDFTAAVSVGVAVGPSRNVRASLAAADDAMYVAKRGGGGRFCVAPPLG